MSDQEEAWACVCLTFTACIHTQTHTYSRKRERESGIWSMEAQICLPLGQVSKWIMLPRASTVCLIHMTINAAHLSLRCKHEPVCHTDLTALRAWISCYNSGGWRNWRPSFCAHTLLIFTFQLGVLLSIYHCPFTEGVCCHSLARVHHVCQHIPYTFTSGAQIPNTPALFLLLTRSFYSIFSM